MTAIIQCHEVKQRLAEGAVVIDVMTPEDYAACHVAGAGNACIYEIVFLDRIAELVAGLNTDLIVYDATGTTRTAEVARERLLLAGYTRVSILGGGLAAWHQAGLAVEGGAEPAFPESAAADGTYLLDVQQSRIEWIGRSLNNRHIGQLAITEGNLVIGAGRPRSAEIIVDMHSLTNFDLQDPAYRDMLIAHLKSDDFLAVDRFPTAALTIRSWEEEAEAFPIALGGIATILAFAVAGGMSFGAAVAFLGLFLATLLTLARIRAELGLPTIELYQVGADDIMQNLLGTRLCSSRDMKVISEC